MFIQTLLILVHGNILTLPHDHPRTYMAESMLGENQQAISCQHIIPKSVVRGTGGASAPHFWNFEILGPLWGPFGAP